MKTSVIGGGSWGSAFAIHLGRNGIETKLWFREREIYEAAVRDRENPVFLPGFKFPPPVTFHHGLEDAVRDADLVFLAVPSQFCRRVLVRLAPHLAEGQDLVSLAKGIEKRTLLRMTEVAASVLGRFAKPRLGVLSGPSFAREVAQGHPTALVLASRNLPWARSVQHLVSSPSLRVYTSRDVLGVEIAGALKNIVAIAAGINDSLQFGDNARAALMTRGLAEITRLSVKLGARKETFLGLAGVGDLVLTCTGRLSRNRHLGAELGKGRDLAGIIGSTRMVVEGIATTVSARRLALREGVEMPLTEQIYRILYHRKEPRKALADLMSRTLKGE